MNPIRQYTQNLKRLSIGIKRVKEHNLSLPQINSDYNQKKSRT
jgi:hypothetical protein